jgi:RHS repeat-associated protein
LDYGIRTTADVRHVFEHLTYDAVGNRLTAVEGTNYGHDDNGSLTSRGSDSFAWNAAGRMTNATVSSTTTTFAYNGDGLRDSRTQGSTTTFTWDVNRGVPQVIDDGTFKYVYGLGRLCEIGPGTTTHYYLPDGLGSTMGLVSSSGASVNAYDYDVFGGIRSQTGSQGNECQFAGEQVDSSTGLQYLRERYYDMATGRFLGQDPLGGGCIYAANNPLSFKDPTGLYVDCQPDKESGGQICSETTNPPAIGGPIWYEPDPNDPGHGIEGPQAPDPDDDQEDNGNQDHQTPEDPDAPEPPPVQGPFRYELNCYWDCDEDGRNTVFLDCFDELSGPVACYSGGGIYSGNNPDLRRLCKGVVNACTTRSEDYYQGSCRFVCETD